MQIETWSEVTASGAVRASALSPGRRGLHPILKGMTSDD